MNWLEIADACEKATGPSREIDFAIDVALLRPAVIKGFQARAAYTASLDAIVALIERESSVWGETNADLTGGPAYMASFRDNPESPWFDSKAATPALALCAAFARAMHEKEK